MTVLTSTKAKKVSTPASNRLVHELPREKLAWMLQRMCEIRYFEEKAEDLYIRGLVHGTMHLSIGMEAGSVGSIATLRPEDLIIHHHRGHGHTIAKGADLTIMMAEFLGRETGYCRGRGGSMHIFDRNTRFYGGNAIVGGGLPLAVGLALGEKMQGRNALTENYSVLRPEVGNDAGGRTIEAANLALVDHLLSFDRVIVAGEAKSHCVAWTIDDLLEGDDERERALAPRTYLLEDCTSPVVVPGADYTDQAAAAFRRFEDAGMHVVCSTDPIESWPGLGEILQVTSSSRGLGR